MNGKMVYLATGVACAKGVFVSPPSILLSYEVI